jgi:hypothetical protein
MSPPSSGPKNKPSKKRAFVTCFHAGFLLSLFFGPEDGSDMRSDGETDRETNGETKRRIPAMFSCKSAKFSNHTLKLYILMRWTICRVFIRHILYRTTIWSADFGKFPVTFEVPFTSGYKRKRNLPVQTEATHFCLISLFWKNKSKGKVVPVVNQLRTTPWRRMGEWMYRSTLFLTSALAGGEW